MNRQSGDEARMRFATAVMIVGGSKGLMESSEGEAASFEGCVVERDRERERECVFAAFRLLGTRVVRWGWERSV